MHPKTQPITRRENLLRVLAGQEPAWVPFAPNIWQWFNHRKTKGTLPEVLRGCNDHLDAQLALGNDIFSRNVDGGYRQTIPSCHNREVREETPLGTRITYYTDTPFGTMRTVTQEQRAISTEHTEEYPIKSWDEMGKACRWYIEQLEITWDPAPFVILADRVGDAGVVNLPLGQTPLKILHQFCGLDAACIAIADHPDEVHALCEAFWAKLRPVIQQAADHPRVDSIILMDNIDTPFYPPKLAKRYWAPYVADAADIMRARGKHLFVHACGKLKGLAPVFADTRVSGLEGVSHAPLGDWSPGEAVACHDRFVYVGGFSPIEQGWETPQVVDYFSRFLERTPRHRVVFSTSCNTEINTPFERILALREVVRAWGGAPS